MKITTIGKVLLFLVLAMLTSYMALASVFVDKVELTPTEVNTNQDLTCKWTLSGSEDKYFVNVTILKNNNEFSVLKDVESAKGVNQAVVAKALDTAIDNTWVCRVLATDAKTASDGPKDSNVVTIKNQAPKFTGTIPAFTVSEDSGESAAKDISALAKDDDGSEQTLTFSISSEDTSKVDCTVSADGKALTVKPAADFFTTTDAAKCKVQVTDGKQTDEKEFSITVNNVNDDPAFTTAATLAAATVNQSYTAVIAASDKDGDKLTFTVDPAAPAFLCPSGMNNCFSGITDNSVTLAFTPTQEGTFNFKMTISDGVKQVSKTFALTVSKTGTTTPVAPGSTSLLAFKDIKVYVDGKKESDVDETGGTASDVRPGSKLRVKVDVENNWPSSDKDHQINDVEVEAELEDVGGESDSQDDTLEYKDLDPGDDDSDEIQFDIADDAEEGTYELKLTLTGKDDFDNTKYGVNKTVNIRIRKESHSVKLLRYQLNPSTISCTRTTKLSFEVVNQGRNDENVQLVLKANKDLGIEEKIELFNLQEGDIDDEDTFVDKQYTFNIPTNVKPGPYPIEVQVFFNDDKEDDTDSAILVIADCGSTTPVTTLPSGGTGAAATGAASSGTASQTEKKQQVEVVATTTAPSQTPVTTPTTAAVATLPSQSVSGFLEGSGYIAFLVVAIIVVLIVIIVLIVAIARRKE